MITLELAVADGLDAAPDRAGLEAAVAAVLAEAGIADDDETVVALDVRLIERAESADLNGRFRDKPYATNVLSFPADAALPGLHMLGDLAICMPVVADEAAAQGKTETAHLLHMVVHGTFHLLGYDHIGDDEAEIMEAAERRVMAHLGYADPYGATAAATPPG
ncbi:rRNA maturation RNase YbeY [Salinisphaera sp. Q1T1-3]|uniref:rRNA maturation RNase YbeY n=1 Tax=Salinisphaera sp. Q1T1-3 TaxID=2321229 RepID=UPI000E74C57A|nr:rRNA maturation RNase YbeY [Salinisphaera sp. Q1T1-3]RJS92179.1 rRNA maturation RNase YbeY [Salinisphaera sp. Q1T1-3]